MEGIIIVNKSKGCTSNDVVNKVKHILKCKVGHTGTLDPNATGVLPLLLGKGTKFSKYLINHDKKYCATLQLGVKTTTADIEGKIIEEQNVDGSIYNELNIQKALKKFIGKNIQTPPIYSAIKINGKKLYEYARKGEDVEIPVREIEIYNIDLISIDKETNQIVFEVECSKGTYIRALCEDIASSLGTIGFMKELNRLVVGSFKIEDSVSTEEIEQYKDDKNWLRNHIITLERLLIDSQEINIGNEKIDKYLNGVNISVNVSDGIYRIYNNGTFIGSGFVKNNFLKRDIVL
ncbi:MAG: tRNA pseudouridine(55) synthase TruB [Clostridia bacterium]|nr:tRNA pseudouridine(55) synthase TruB [Clostridia bacterium]